ncbi:alcohol dehydrogenase [Rhodococcus sp. Leaf7]|uniref:NADP-dependent oxidoreductase n=1 Tax=unclassified Rhodococcus (in: high G+C Gram-positive bacteria) TaxID=192944 RepID=UPI0006FC1CC1|nr:MULTISPECIES: NADP-dependent oxidoreductase [unclassified Rhodococcus (in: high G+C Gram-positive bacteria)]KQU03113.1 alcohol dehydrogenase [Rhodococcus sp. Leaf7]KQU38914.1 alcohol dehydrogenase [Rhodococcus sp. Leaf247]
MATAFGGPEVVELREVDLGEPGDGMVLVEVRAAGVNPIDYKLYSGAFGTDSSRLPMPLGAEASGVVLAVSANADGPAGPVSVGDEVIVLADGAYAERIIAPAGSILPKPASLDWAEAASYLLTAATAWDIVELSGVGEGDCVLIHGASGSVGSQAIQLAVHRGAQVIGTASPRNLDAVRALGAVAVPYGDGLLDRVRTAAPDGVDVALDTVGTDEAVDVSLALVEDRTRIVTIAAFGRAADEGFPSVGGGNAESAARRERARLTLLDLAGSVVTVTIAAKYPLDKAARAHRELGTNHPRGKYVLEP